MELILNTKLHVPPLRPGLVPRARLIERLDEGCRAGCRLILISAPAGYGKTTLLSEWAHGREVAWLTLDEGDNDPARFAAHLIAAFQTLDAATGRDLLVALQSPQPPSLETLCAALLNQLDAISDPFTLALDDYHRIAALPIHQAVAFLLDHLPPQMCMVIATRSDPLLPIARLRGRGHLMELRQEDMRFTMEEAAQFLEGTMGLVLPNADVSTLVARTEGWAAGLQMAALSLQAQPGQAALVQAFGGSHRYIFDYLLEEVLSHQPVGVQEFLLKTSILERLTAPLCDAVMQEEDQEGLPGHPFSDSQATLEYLERANLFLIPLDDGRQWYRFHHLFADLLRQRLRQSAGAEACAALHLRAAAWFEREGLIAEAVASALAAPDDAYAARLIVRHGLPLFYRGETVLLHGWLKALPEAVIKAQPLLCAIFASCLALAQQSPESFAEAEAWLDRAEAALEKGSGAVEAADSPTRDEIVGFVLKFRAYLARFRGDPPDRVIALSLQALERLPAGNLWFRSALYFNLGVAYWDLGDEKSASGAWTQAREVGVACGDLLNAVSAVASLAAAARMRGGLREAATICRDALQSIVAPAERTGQSLPIAGILYVSLGSIQAEWNDLEDAERALTRGLELLALTAASQSRIEGHLALARVKQAQGDWDGALRVLEQAEKLYPLAASGGSATPFRGRAACVVPHRVRLWLQRAGDDPRWLTEAERWARERHMTPGAEEDRVEQLTFARLVIVQHRRRAGTAELDLPTLIQSLDRQLCRAQAKGWVGWQIEVTILQALARHVQGDLEQALDGLHQALTLAEPEGYARIFLDEGPPLVELLHLSRQRGVWRGPRLAEYVGRLLDACSGSKIDRGEDQPVSPGSPAFVSGLIEPLSARELEVLYLMGDGLSNRQIAERLVVTLGTVKAHVHNIYGKLGVERRTQAVARARELKLL